MEIVKFYQNIPDLFSVGDTVIYASGGNRSAVYLEIGTVTKVRESGCSIMPMASGRSLTTRKWGKVFNATQQVEHDKEKFAEFFI